MINPVHLHLMLNHVPVLGSIFALAVLSWGLARRSQELQKVGLAVMAAVALIALPVFFTGEPAEKAVEHMAGVTESVIDEHEEAANMAFGSALAGGAIALLTLILVRRGRPVPGWAKAVTLIACFVTVVLMARTANLGGRIHHPELGSTDANKAQTEANADADSD